MSLAQHAAFIACVALANFVQNLTGFAFALLLLGLVGLFHIAPLPDATNVASVLTLVNAAALFRASAPQVERTVLPPTLIASLLGVLAGVGLLSWLSDNVVAGLRVLLGLTIIGCAVILLIETRAQARRSSTASFVAVGLGAGVLGGLFSTAGPPLVFHFYRQPMAPRAIRDSLVAIFAANALVRLVALLAVGRIGSETLWLCAEATPVVLAQTWWMARRSPAWSVTAVRRVVCALLLIVGASLVLPALIAR
jgi:uncharacterized membrane protein YfcA